VKEVKEIKVGRKCRKEGNEGRQWKGVKEGRRVKMQEGRKEASKEGKDEGRV
jgi:hypothetical protein